MTDRKNIASGSKWEDIIGYSRAVRIGNVIEVSGTTAAVDAEGNPVNDPYGQTKLSLEKIEKALNAAGASMSDVVRTRIFAVDISRWEEIGRAHGEIFKDIKPVTTMVEVKALIGDELLVEIEATAILSK